MLICCRSFPDIYAAKSVHHHYHHLLHHRVTLMDRCVAPQWSRRTAQWHALALQWRHFGVIPDLGVSVRDLWLQDSIIKTFSFYCRADELQRLSLSSFPHVLIIHWSQLWVFIIPRTNAQNHGQAVKKSQY